MSAGEYLEGAGFFIATLAATLWGALLLLRRRWPGVAGAERAVAYAVLATVGVLAVHVVPGILGILGRGSVLAASLVWLVACSRVPASPDTGVAASEAPGAGREEDEDPVSRISAGLAIGVVAVFTLAFVRDQLTALPPSIDFMNFHMSGVASWIQSGSIWQVDAFVPFVAPGNYPSNGDVLLLAGALPWSNDFLAHLVMLPFYPLAGVATYALARRLGAVRAPAAVAGCLVMAMPAVAIPPLSDAIVDAVMVFAFAAGVLFLVRHHHSEATADLVLAGLALGISFGTKWYGVSAVAIVVAVWLVARLLARVGPRLAVRQAGIVIALVALLGGIWLLRNWIISGNPVFPVKVAILGVTIFDAPPDLLREEAGFTILDYVGDWKAWDEFILPQFRTGLAAPALLVLVGLLVAAVLVVRRPRPPQAGVLLAASLCAALLIAATAITPYTAGGPEGLPVLVDDNARYGVPGLVAAAGLAAWVAGIVRWGPALFCGAGLIAVVDGVNEASSGELSPVELELGQWAFGLAALAAVAALAWALVKLHARLAEPQRRLALAAGGLVVGLIAVGAGYEIQERYNAHRYRADPVIGELLAEADGGSRVGLAGLWDNEGIAPPLPAFGSRFGNEVEYVGPLEREKLGRYEDRDQFIAALEREDFDYLIVGRGRRGQPPPRDGRWALRAGFELVARSTRLDLLRKASPSASLGPR